MCLVLMFNLFEDIKQSMKLLLVYKKTKKKLNLENYEFYASDREDASIPKSEKKSLIDAASPQLAHGVCVASTFHQAFVDPLEL